MYPNVLARRKGPVDEWVPEPPPPRPPGDVFAVGILLWELITGARFWRGTEEITILRRLLEGDIPKLPEHACPPRLAAVCARALASKPDARFANAEQFRQELDAAALELGPRSSLEDLSRRMTLAFAESRQRIGQLVEAGGAIAEGAPLPSVAMSVTETSRASGSGVPSTSLGSSAASVVAVEQPRPSVAGQPPRRWLAAVALALVGSTAAVAAFRARPNTIAPATTTAAQGATESVERPAAAPSNGPARAGIVEIVIDVTPPNARVSLDGVGLAGQSPYRKRLERDDRTHEIEVSAAGYDTEQDTITLDGNLTMRVALTKAEGRAPTAVRIRKKAAATQAMPATPDPTAPAVAAPPAITAGVLPKRDINAANPYGN